ncbi:trypsin-like serine protease [Lentzea sp. NPDC058450]|uniref:trypsin-like serine protease n=1 Tax=Lentzea sp. NPDC058450 TaxID=3346505 RepID=UPI00364ED512
MRSQRKLGMLVLSLPIVGVLTAAVLTAMPTEAVSPSLAGLNTSAGPRTGPALDTAAVRESIDYLTRTYRVDEREAVRRLELQNTANELEATLKREAPDEYGGMWLDQEAGGKLVVTMTNSAAALRHVDAAADRAHIEVRTVPNALAALWKIRDLIGEQVGEGPDSVYLPAVSETENRVVVWERSWLRPSQPSTRSFVPAEPGMVSTKVLPKPVQFAGAQGPCLPLQCAYDGPMRGGLRLDLKRDDGTVGGCTSGFNLRSTGGAFPGVPWVLTAGHCMATKTNNAPTRHAGQPVLNQHGIEKNSYPFDYAAVQYVDVATAGRWLESQSQRNLVLSRCFNGGLDSNADTPCGPQEQSRNQEITKVTPLAAVKTGSIVCASGSGSSKADFPDSVDSGAGAGYLPGTRCGRVVSTDVGINTDVCARAGDSGGPLFSQLDKAALGILEGSQQARTGACQPGELNNYAPLSTILEDLSARQASGGSVFTVITTPRG